MTPDDALLEIERLQKRLARERRAREAAEQIAEGGTRELYTQQQRLALLQQVTEAANATSSFDAALETVLHAICRHTGWQVGHAYVVTHDPDPVLISSGLWHVDSPDAFSRLRDVSAHMRFAPGQGLPGRVLALAEPVWIVEIDRDDNFPRRKESNLNVRGAFAFPVLLDHDVAAVFEFFSRDPAPRDDDFVMLSRQISLQLSRIFERQRADAIMREATAAAEAGNRAKSEFLATMSHEIRTPMNGVIGFTNLLLDTPLSEQQREFTTTIQRSGESLLTIINDILDFSKIEAKKLLLEDTPYELHATVGDVAELLSTDAEKKGIEIVLHIEERVPEIVVGDSSRLRQVLFNFVGNAVKFTDRGHVFIRMEHLPEAGATGERIRVSVTDTGIGIAPEKQALLFRMFTQADASTTRKFGGTGLGLAISKGLIERMGGTVGVRSTPGEGSMFWLELPVQRPAEREPERHMVSLDGVRALIVDDLDVNRRVLQLQLQAWGLVVDIAASGADALALMRAAAASSAPYALALLDFLMPEMDGEMLARAIKADPSVASTALILLTSGGFKSDEPHFLAAGFAAYLMKPVARPQRLRDAIIRVLDTQSAAPAVDGTEPSILAGTTPAAGPHPHRTIRVLLAEDNAVNQRLATLLLRKRNCAVDVASNGREAVDLFEQFPYDCIFMDCQMPEVDGYEATQAIRRLETPGRRTPIIAATANAMTGDQERCLAAGMDDYISKPLKGIDLERALRRWVPAAHDDGAEEQRVGSETSRRAAG